MKRPNQDALAKIKKFKPRGNNEDTPGLGIILSITLRNFMCHEFLEFEFDPHINFIVGQNGSGKSAVLTAIMLALGAKANTTGRFSNIKGFVKTGKSKATISITLKNCGVQAFKPEIYGDKIIVEREISIEGVSAYKMKTAAGKIVTNSKEELTNILIAMDIQIDNPVLVLTQETSRNFLMAKTGKEEKLYEFFYRGTGLQRLEDDYKLSYAITKDCEKDLAAKKLALDVMEKEVKRLEKIRKSDEKLDELKRESFWAKVTSMEQELEIQNIARAKLMKNIAVTKSEAEKSKNKHDEETLALEKHKKDNFEIGKKLSEERASYTELLNQSDKCAGIRRKCAGEVERFKREELKLIEDIGVIQNAINDHQVKDQTYYENERKERNEKILELQEQISNIEIQQAELGKKHEELLQDQNSKQQEINQLRSEIDHKTAKRNMRIQERNQLINAKKNRQFLFGDYTPQILQEINQNKQNFKKLPRGPIGLDIEVKDPKWTGAIEACIKPNILQSFCVDNAQDSVLMTRILRKYYNDRMPSVIVSPFLSQVHDVSRHKAQTNKPTVLDMLTIKDPVVANCLIDQLSIENKILIEDITTAQNIMLDHPPARCYSAFLLNCDEILLNPYRHYSASRKPTNVLSQNVDESFLVHIQEKINEHETEIREKQSAIADIRSQLQDYPNISKELERKLVRLTASKSDFLGAIEELKQFEEPKNVPDMHDEFLSLSQDLGRKQEELKAAEEKLESLDRERTELNEKCNRQKKLFKHLQHQIETLGSSINQCGRNKELLASSKKQFETELVAMERNLKQLEYEIEVADNGIKKTIADRQEVENKRRIVTKRSYQEIDIQIEEMQKVISQESNSKDKASLLEKYIEKNRRLHEAKLEYKQIERYNMEILKMMKKREKKTKDICKFTQFVVNLSFTVFLKGNGFTGAINFDKPNSLRLEATPKQENPESGGKKSCSSLSGGERSFVTIAFLIALWERIQMPFRILDEYDVFMDSCNRHLCVNLLIDKAKQMKDVQFIFLSPLGMPELRKSNKDIKQHWMPSPQRIGLSNMEQE